MTDLERIKQITNRFCGLGILVKGETFEENDYVVQRRAGEKHDEVVRIPGEWVRNQQWNRIEEAIRNACK